jgi:hypothetical protein
MSRKASPLRIGNKQARQLRWTRRHGHLGRNLACGRRRGVSDAVGTTAERREGEG